MQDLSLDESIYHFTNIYEKEKVLSYFAWTVNR